jgi:protein required for attachment to host cells
MAKRRTTWIVIADGGHARIVKRRDDATGFEMVTEIASSAAHLPSRAIGSDRPGRVHESANAAHHAIEPRTDPHMALKTAFIDTLADHLNLAEGRKEFDRLILIAPARCLGELRHRLGAATAAKVTAALAKDLTKLPLDQLDQHLAGVSRAPATNRE